MQDLEYSGINLNLANTGTTVTGAAATVTLAAATVAAINGAFTTALALGAKTLNFVSEADGATAKPATNLAAGQACVVVNCVDAAGTFKNLQGPIQALDAQGNLVNPAAFPKVPDNLVAFSWFSVKNTTNPFIFGTTLWNAAGVTVATVNCAALPSRPVWP